MPTIANYCQLLPTVTTQVGAGAVARLAIALGAGRLHPSDTLDLGAGVELRVEPGDVVRSGPGSTTTGTSRPSCCRVTATSATSLMF